MSSWQAERTERRAVTGRLFEIREFTLHDGPGIRTTVFMKGCPLRCAWCHNPEGQLFARETMRRKDGSSVPCGEDWEAAELVAELEKNADILLSSGGGVTFSGGEPLAQADFLLEVAELMAHPADHAPIPLALETSGAVPVETYRRVVPCFDFVYQDLKHHDPEAFRRWCGGELEQVLANVAWLKASSVRHVFRVPVIPSINDTPADRAAFVALAGSSPLEFLPYNPAAGAKYAMLGRPYPLVTGQAHSVPI